MTTVGDDEDYLEFKRWMAEFELGDDGEHLKTLWDALQKLSTTKIDLENIETLVRLALKSRQCPEQAKLSKITAYFNADASFSATNNARELEVLAAVALLRIARSRNDELAAQAALSVATSLFAGARKVNLPFDLLGLTAAAIDALARAAGRRPQAPIFKQVPRVSFELGGKALAGSDFGNASQGIINSGADADKAIQQLANQFFSVTRTVTRILQQQDEELQMLWWQLGGRSEDLDLPFSKVSGDRQALVLAKELATHTTLLPGPSSVPTLLARAGLKAQGRVEVVKAINACDVSWLAPLVDGLMISPVIHPIHFGIQRQLEVGDGLDWVANWAAVTELKASLSFAPLTLGEQFYRERLLLQTA